MKSQITKVFLFIGLFLFGMQIASATYVPDVTLSVDSNKNISIDFDSIYDTDKYNVYRVLNLDIESEPIPWEFIGETVTNKYIDTTGQQNYKYNYKVCSVKDDIEGICLGYNNSIVVPIKMPVITVVNNGYNSLKINWNNVDVDGYEVYRATSATGKYTKVSTTSALTYTNTSLSFNTTYYYKVRAYVKIDGVTTYGPYSAVKSAKTLTVAPKATAASASYNSVKVSWGAVSGATGYEVYRYDTKTKAWKRITTITKNATVTFTDKSLATGTSYKYKVRAYRTVSGKKIYGAYSSEITGKPIPGLPGATATAQTSTNTKITVSSVTGATGYEVRQYLEGTLLGTKTITKAGDVSFSTIFNTTYKYEVLSYRTVSGKKVYSNIRTINLKATPAQLTTKNLVTTITSIQFNFGTTEVVDGYVIKKSTSANGQFDVVLDTTEGTQLFLDDNLNKNATYYYELYSYKLDDDSNRVYSSVKKYTYKTLPTAPTITISNSSYTSLKISWSAISQADGYEIYRATSASGKYTLIKTVTGTTFNNTGLKFNTSYYYKVRAYSLVNGKKVYGAYSAVKNLKVLVNSPSLTAVSASYNTTKLTWSKLSGATGYEVYRYDTKAKAWKKITTITKNATVTFTDKSLITGTTYQYRVRGYRTVGGKKIYGVYSKTMIATPIPATPGATGIAVGSADTKITVPAISGATGYEIRQYSEGLLLDTKNLSKAGAINFQTVLNTDYVYEVYAYRTVNGTKIYSNAKIINLKATPSQTTIDQVFTATSFIAFEYGGTTENVDGYVIKRSTSANGSFVTVWDRTFAELHSDGYEFVDMDVKPNTTYYYQLYTYQLDGDGNRVYSVAKAYSYKTVPYKPIYAVYQTGGDSITLYMGTGAIATFDVTGYEIYRSTSKTGTYTKVATIKAEEYNNKGLKFNTTYYYKIRAYKVIDGKTYYGPYSDIKSAKTKMNALDSFPLTLITSDYYNEYKVSSTTFTFKKASGNNIEYTVTIKGTINAKSKEKTGLILVFYDAEGNYLTYKQKSFDMSKGKYSKTITFTITIPKNAVYYEFY
jgi:Fibronectin type 3 domain-containing protein